MIPCGGGVPASSSASFFNTALKAAAIGADGVGSWIEGYQKGLIELMIVGRISIPGNNNII